MKRQISSILLKSLVSTEFLILQSKQRLRVKKIKNSVLNRVDCKVDSSLDLFELVKSLKQFVRVLQLLKIYAEGKLIVSSSNKNIYSFLDLYVKRVSHLEFLEVRSECTRSFGVSKNIRGLLLLDESIEGKARNVQKLLREKIILVTALNSIKESNAYSTYKIYNDILDFKKLAFLMTLISSVAAGTKKL